MYQHEAIPFTAEIRIIGINPFVYVPEQVLECIFKQAGKTKGQIPVTIKIDENEFKQTLVKYAGSWRLLLNTPMRKAAGKEVGDTATFEMIFDSEERYIPMPVKLAQALSQNKKAKNVFESIAPYLQKEIARYINNLKTTAAVDKNVERAISFLLGEERFIGRDKPM